MTNGPMAARLRRQSLWRRMLAVGVFALSPLLTAGCQTHHVAVGYACPGITTHTAVVLSRRGGMGLAKIGATPRMLKLEQKCRITP